MVKDELTPAAEETDQIPPEEGKEKIEEEKSESEKTEEKELHGGEEPEDFQTLYEREPKDAWRKVRSSTERSSILLRIT